MSFLELLLLAIGLSMDAFSVALASGIGLKPFSRKKALKMAFFFGLFQAIMPIIGWLLCLKIKDIILVYAPWVAFILLAFLGIKMIVEAIINADKEETKSSPFENKNLLILSLATSIDAMATGISFLGLKVNIIHSSTLIGLTTFALSYAGVKIGNKGLNFLGSKAELLGGLMLILIGIKILLTH